MDTFDFSSTSDPMTLMAQTHQSMLVPAVSKAELKSPPILPNQGSTRIHPIEDTHVIGRPMISPLIQFRQTSDLYISSTDDEDEAEKIPAFIHPSIYNRTTTHRKEVTEMAIYLNDEFEHTKIKLQKQGLDPESFLEQRTRMALMKTEEVDYPKGFVYKFAEDEGEKWQLPWNPRCHLLLQMPPNAVMLAEPKYIAYGIKKMRTPFKYKKRQLQREKKRMLKSRAKQADTRPSSSRYTGNSVEHQPNQSSTERPHLQLQISVTSNDETLTPSALSVGQNYAASFGRRATKMQGSRIYRSVESIDKAKATEREKMIIGGMKTTKKYTSDLLNINENVKEKTPSMLMDPLLLKIIEPKHPLVDKGITGGIQEDEEEDDMQFKRRLKETKQMKNFGNALLIPGMGSKETSLDARDEVAKRTMSIGTYDAMVEKNTYQDNSQTHIIDEEKHVIEQNSKIVHSLSINTSSEDMVAEQFKFKAPKIHLRTWLAESIVENFLYMGDNFDAQNYCAIRELEITCFINCAAGDCNHNLEKEMKNKWYEHWKQLHITNIHLRHEYNRTRRAIRHGKGKELQLKMKQELKVMSTKGREDQIIRSILQTTTERTLDEDETKEELFDKLAAYDAIIYDTDSSECSVVFDDITDDEWDSSNSEFEENVDDKQYIIDKYCPYRYLNVYAHNWYSYPIIDRHLTDVWQFLESALNDKRQVLIYCCKADMNEDTMIPSKTTNAYNKLSVLDETFVEYERQQSMKAVNRVQYKLFKEAIRFSHPFEHNSGYFDGTQEEEKRQMVTPTPKLQSSYFTTESMFSVEDNDVTNNSQMSVVQRKKYQMVYFKDKTDAQFFKDFDNLIIDENCAINRFFGQSYDRSACLVLAFLINNGIDLKLAYSALLTKRPNALVRNQGFLRALIRLNFSIHRIGEMKNDLPLAQYSCLKLPN